MNQPLGYYVTLAQEQDRSEARAGCCGRFIRIQSISLNPLVVEGQDNLSVSSWIFVEMISLSLFNAHNWLT